MRSNQPQHRRYVNRTPETGDLYALVFDGAPRGMLLLALDGRILRANRAACVVLRRAAEEMSGNAFDAFLSPEDAGLDDALATKLLRGEIERYQVEKRCARGDGTKMCALLAFSLLRDRHGQPGHRAWLQHLR